MSDKHSPAMMVIKRKSNPMDNKDKSGSPDRDRINVNQDFELQYWSKKFNVSAGELKAAVKKAGTSATEVEKLLKKG